MAVSNMVRNYPYEDCSIEEVALYTPGDLTTGAFNYEWNGHGFGKTGTTGFDVLRWNWTTYHNNNQPMQYTIRWGETIETIAFDWKISPESLLAANQLTADAQLTPGQVITLPAYAETMP
ncbi:MAG: LysM peptidoglycan-binding domain-containing protein [Anaerolineales bacterium]|nr:LysM peptidoglycan-binding domain-containing protein [Anaerolineales bacterium]